jgi:PP-loop superfamily ATP-utilizing enzyme
MIITMGRYNMELEKKIEQLKDYLKDKKVLIAFSGGADSSLVAYVHLMFLRNH